MRQSHILNAFDLKTGNLMWEHNTYLSYVKELVYAKHKLYVGGQVQVVDGFTGELQKYVFGQRGTNSPFTLKINDSIYYSSEHGN